jgi:hypothetical protein
MTKNSNNLKSYLQTVSNTNCEDTIINFNDKNKSNNKLNNNKNNYKNIYNIDINLIDIDDEFDHEYLSKITDLKLEFNEYINMECLPFLNKLNIKDYNFYDFIKYNSENYNNTIDKVNKENEEYIKLLEEDMQHEMEDELNEVD